VHPTDGEKYCSFSFLNHDYTEEDEEDEKGTLI
jgi:hypothetical protein